MFDSGSADDESQKKLSYYSLVPALGHSLGDLLLRRAEDEISVHFFFHDGIDQDCPSVKGLDGNSAVSDIFGTERGLAAVTLLGGSGHATFEVNIFVFRHFLERSYINDFD